MKVRVRVDICSVLKGQCLHALYFSSVHVSDQHQNKHQYILKLLDQYGRARALCLLKSGRPNPDPVGLAAISIPSRGVGWGRAWSKAQCGLPTYAFGIRGLGRTLDDRA